MPIEIIRSALGIIAHDQHFHACSWDGPPDDDNFAVWNASVLAFLDAKPGQRMPVIFIPAGGSVPTPAIRAKMGQNLEALAQRGATLAMIMPGDDVGGSLKRSIASTMVLLSKRFRTVVIVRDVDALVPKLPPTLIGHAAALRAVCAAATARTRPAPQPARGA